MIINIKKLINDHLFPKMKVIHVLSALTKGGGERIAVELANQSADNGDAVTILAGWPEDPDFLRGNIYPDIRYLKFISRENSHIPKSRIPYVVSVGNNFEKGIYVLIIYKIIIILHLIKSRLNTKRTYSNIYTR